jgi:hypothetical protein
MRLHIKRLDPGMTARRLGGGRIFIDPDNQVGVVRRCLVSSVTFLRKPIDRDSTALWLDSGFGGGKVRAVGSLFGIFVHDMIGVLRETVTGIDWVVRAGAEALGRALGGRYVIRAVLEDGRSFFWKVEGWRPPEESIEEIALAMTIGDFEFVPKDAVRFLVD